MSTQKQAFAILGITPTDDGRVIRSAFLRLARIYHPDRFVDMPDDVRGEAERRMKEATIAYESLRTTKRADEPPSLPPIDDAELQRRAAKYREAAEKKKSMDEFDRARWRKWEEAERIARDRAKREADIASRLEDEVNSLRVRSDAKPTTDVAEPDAIPAKRNGKSRLNERLDAAKRGETHPLVPQSGAAS